MANKLNTKLWRDLASHRGQALAIALVVACGISTYIAMRSSYRSMLLSQQTYYDLYRFADVFCSLRRAPEALIREVEKIPGVAAIQTRIVREVTVDIPGFDEPATARLVSIPDTPTSMLNGLFIRRGRYIQPGQQDEIIMSEGFAAGHGLNPGDRIGAVINGRWRRLHIVGVGLSPEYVYEVQGGGALFPDNKRFGVVWMGRGPMSAAFDMKGAFNDLSCALSPEASTYQALARLDRLLEPYGGAGAIDRERQVSHRFLSDELKGNYASGTVTPMIFLGVAAFLLHIVMSRLVRTQRDQIAILKAFGYTDRSIGLHYTLFAWITVSGGLILGTGAGIWLGMGITALYQDFYRFPLLQFDPGFDLILASVFIAFGTATVGALYSTRQAVSLPPAEAMRPEPPERFHIRPLERMGLYRLVSPSIRMILRNLERRPIKFLLSVWSMSFAVAILVVGRSGFDGVDFLLDFQFRTVQREDVTVTFNTPLPIRALNDLQHLPGVLFAEPYRIAPVRIRAGHRTHLTALYGFVEPAQLRRALDRSARPMPLPGHGVVMTSTLADMLDIRRGDHIRLELLEGKRQTLDVPVTALIDELIGVSLYMELSALQDRLGEGRSLSGAFLDVDDDWLSDLYIRLKAIPAISGVSVREAAIENFEKTIAENMAISTIMLILFSSVIAAGMVYNGARIALAERSREMASLRVLGFTRREITLILLGEQGVITFLSIPLGFVLGWWLSWLIMESFASELYRMPVVISMKTYGYALLIIVAAAAASGRMVRRRLRHLDLIGVLKTRE